MSPVFAALMASQTASGVNAAAVRVSARTAAGNNPPAARRKDNASHAAEVILIWRAIGGNPASRSCVCQARKRSRSICNPQISCLLLFDIQGPFLTPGQAGSDGATGRRPFFGVTWYRKHLAIPAADSGKQFYVDIDGAMSYATVWRG
jgi:hypothetical protein